jgi:hypothetical protein
MNQIINQFRRLYDDKGQDDHDFTKQEERLKDANLRLVEATNQLLRASERLNVSALNSLPMWVKH